MVGCRRDFINAQAGHLGQHKLEPHDRPAPLFQELFASLRIAGKPVFPYPMAFNGIPVCHSACVHIYLLLGNYPVSEAGQPIGQPVAPVILAQPLKIIVAGEHNGVDRGGLFPIDLPDCFWADEVIDGFGNGRGGIIWETGILDSDTEADSIDALKTDKVRETINR
jgi:hypothetical protein